MSDRVCRCGDAESQHIVPDETGWQDRPCLTPLCGCPQFQWEEDGP